MLSCGKGRRAVELAHEVVEHALEGEVITEAVNLFGAKLVVAQPEVIAQVPLEGSFTKQQRWLRRNQEKMRTYHREYMRKVRAR